MPEPAASPAPNALPPAAQLLNLIHGYAPSQLVYIAAKLMLADHISRGVQTTADLAAATGTPAEPLGRVLRGLISCGVLAEATDGAFSLTSIGEKLQTLVPGSLHGLALIHGELFYPAWGRLLSSVQSGDNAFEQTFGTDFFSYLSDRPHLDDIFNNFMVRLATPTAQALLAAYDFSAARRIVDVGGGYGTLLAPILAHYPQASGVLFDTAPILDGTEHFFAAAGLTAQYEAVAGDFFAGVPAGDHFLLCQILHDWDDEHSRRILENCNDAINEAGKLLVIERLLPERIVPPSEVIEYDVNMLVLGSGRERTEAEYRRLLSGVGFTVTRVVPLIGDKWLLEAIADGA
ncbi:MAG: methyltransferase [Chloroflexota bacterium]|nr:methyltransferase [Chloroflexota bacterium]